MKIKVSTIVWFAVAVFCVACAFVDTESDSPTWKDATYVQDAVVLPENEGKIIAISGHPEPLANATDPVVGVSFPSPFVSRTVQRFKWDDYNEEWKLEYVNGQSDNSYEDGQAIGSMKLGDFTIEPELMRRVLLTPRKVAESDFSAEDIAKMNAEGHVINMNFQLYYSTGPRHTTNLSKWDYANHPEWDGAYLVNWSMWVPKPEDAATIVGIQKGDTLTYCELNYASGEMVFKDEEAFYAEANTEVNTQPIFIFFALICVGMGISTIVKGKKKKA